MHIQKSMQQKAMFKSPFFNLKKASGLCYCCPGVTQATKMLNVHLKRKAENSVSTNSYIIIMPSPIKRCICKVQI